MKKKHTTLPFVFTVYLLLAFNSCALGQQIQGDKIDQFVKAKIAETIKIHREFVSIPCDANYPKDMAKNITWLKDAFEKRAFEVQVLGAGKVPIFFAQKIIDPKKPTVLFYLHFDGQPVDRSKWDQAHPFRPVLKEKNKAGEWIAIPYENAAKKFDPEWRVFGRAAADDKGPIMMMLTAFDIMQEQNLAQAYNVKILLDGQEEKGSAGLKSTLDQYKSIYAADKLIIMDGPAHPTNQATLTFGCRGIASATLTVYGAKLPQHSGHFGNYAPNAAFRLSRLLASMKDDNGLVTIPGFYDGVLLDEKAKAILAAVPDDLLALNTRLGISKPEQVGKNYQESLQYPSLNIRGMSAAWIGKQTRTIVPNIAVAQLGIRLVPETDGERLLGLVKTHIKKQGYYIVQHEPTDAERMQHEKIAFFKGKTSVNAFRTEIDSPTGKWLAKAIHRIHGQTPIQIRIMGGTVPVTPLIEKLGVPAVIVPMVNMDNNQHSPNENLRLGNLYDGIKTCIGILTEGF